MTQEPEQMLPENILLSAIRSGNEYGWREEDVFDAIEAARENGIATIGGQAQFVFPDGTCELYWADYDSTQRKSSESWASYVRRSAGECIVGLKNLLKTKDLVEEGKNKFEFLREKEKAGANIRDHLVFIVYFDVEKEP
jgi:hypothetical protein